MRERVREIRRIRERERERKRERSRSGYTGEARETRGDRGSGGREGE